MPTANITEEQRAKHTPGPWAEPYEDEQDFGPVLVIETDRPTGPNLHTICTLEGRYFEGDFIITDEVRADARLIRAAPELLDALQTVADAYGFDPSIDSSIWQTVFAALAKATGK